MKSTAFLLALLLAPLLVAKAQWQQLPDVPAHSFNTTALTEDILVIAGKYHILRSINGGLNWDTVYTSNQHRLISSFKLNDSTMMVAGEIQTQQENVVLIKSTDYGATWQSSPPFILNSLWPSTFGPPLFLR